MRQRETSGTYWAALAMCALVCGLSAACSSDSEANIGDGELSVDKSQLASYAAAWDGYVEAYTFPSGTDRVRVTLDEDGNGWLQIGDGDELVAPTNPDVGWPEGTDYTKPQGQVGGDLMEGVRYPLVGARVQAERIRLSVDPYDAFTAWCELQTSYLHTNEVPAGYGCSFNSGYSWSENTGCAVGDANGNSVSIDCGKAALCSSAVCACDEDACTAGDGTPMDFDAALDDDGQSLVGSIVLPDVGARIIRLER